MVSCQTGKVLPIGTDVFLPGGSQMVFFQQRVQPRLRQTGEVQGLLDVAPTGRQRVFQPSLSISF
jgi:hypothetical protein